MKNLIKYWSYLVENEDKEISFETFLKKKSNLFEASMKWPEDYLKKAKNRIMNSPLGKSSWYEENHIDKDLKKFEEAFKTLKRKGDFTLGFFLSIIKWFIEYSGSDINKYQEFIEGKLDKIIGILNFIVNQKDNEVSQFHEINKKDVDENGNPRVYRFKKLKDMSWSNFEKEVFQKYSDQISKSVELDKDSLKKSDYEIVPIYSYDELHDKFGGDKTGYKGDSKWCHTNGEDTYDSRAWTDDGKYMFIIFAKKGWENITPPDPKATNAFDEYGTSLIACLFDTNSKKLLHSTLRWNHIIDPAKTRLGASVDNAFLNENDLMNTVGIDLLKDLNEYFKKFKEINKKAPVTFGEKDFKVVNGNINCTHNKLTSLEGAPQEVNGNFWCYNNKLNSLIGAPQRVGGDFECENNNLTSLEGAPQEVGRDFNCSYNKLISLESAPQKVGGDFRCLRNQLTSLNGAPKEVDGDFRCSYNKLTSLEGAPQEVGGNFTCSENKLTSLKGAPKEVSENFYCSDNELTSLEGAPQEVGRDFICEYNKLISLEGAPREVGGDFDCSYNKLTSLEGAPVFIGGEFECDYNPDLLFAAVKAYKAYLKLSDSNKAPLTKDGHYYPTKEWELKFL